MLLKCAIEMKLPWLSDFECGMVVGARCAGVSISEAVQAAVGVGVVMVWGGIFSWHTLGPLVGKPIENGLQTTY